MSSIIVDSGGSKADWAYCNNNGQVQSIIETESFGLEINEQLTLSEILISQLKTVASIYYYGSGISNELDRQKIKNRLSAICTKDCKLSIYSDLLGAARSTAGHHHGYIGILGTGSNFTFYDGTSIHQSKPALGYIIGDEGSGADIGKAIIKAYLYNELPPLEKNIFESHFELTKEILLKKISLKNEAASYLAQFARIGTLSNTEYFNHLIYSKLEELFRRKITTSYENMTYPVHFIGSIAYFYSHLIKKLCSAYNIEVGQIIQKPITGLINYHNE